MRHAAATVLAASLSGFALAFSYAAATGADPQGAATMTPMDQSNSQADLAITAALRRAIIEQNDLSLSAKNVKIITIGGVVTLRGPVASEDERARIEALARKTQGVARVDNQLEVARAD